MRFPVIAALLGASLLTPVAASAQDGRGQNRAERQQARQERQQSRAERPAGMVPPQARQERREVRREFRQERREDRAGFRQERREDRQDFRRDRRADQQQFRNGDVTAREFRSDRTDARRDFRQDRREDVRDFRADRRDDRRDWQRDRADWNDRRGIAGRDWNGDRDWNGNRGWSGDRGWNGNRNWDRGWRAQSRYDWRANRYRNRAAYHLPRYYAPSGWRGGYRRFGIGVTLSSVLWGQNYWIGDPYSYRLPDAWGPYRWVRYYNDALLVDVRSGEVVDVEHDIFW